MVVIKVNTACFLYWGLTFQQIVDTFAEYVEGFEFTLSQEQVINFRHIEFPRKMRNSIHLTITGGAFNAFDKLKMVMKDLDASYVVIHPHYVDHFDYVPDDIPFLIENMDKRHEDYKNVSEVLRLVDSHKNFGFNFDVCHMEETEKGLTSKSIHSFKDRIEAIHVSISDNDNYTEDTHHKLFFDSGVSLPAGLPLDVPWTIEAVIPKGDVDALKKEVAFLRAYSSK